MTYRVTFAKRFRPDGEASEIDPTEFLQLADDVVEDKVMVEQFDPDAKHSQEVLDEDDAFLGMAAAEVWEFQVVEGREDDFVAAMENSQVVMEYEVIDDLNISNV